jgi:hypothetical protein
MTPEQHRFLPCAMLDDEANAGRRITRAEVRSILGPPDFFFEDAGVMGYLYFYQDSGSRCEAYFEFADETLQNVGYNLSGVNDLSRWSPFVE